MVARTIELLTGPEYLRHAQSVTVSLEAQDWRKTYTMEDGTVKVLKKAGTIIVEPQEEPPAGPLRVRATIKNYSGARLDSDLKTIGGAQA